MSTSAVMPNEMAGSIQVMSVVATTTPATMTPNEPSASDAR